MNEIGISTRKFVWTVLGVALLMVVVSMLVKPADVSIEWVRIMKFLINFVGRLFVWAFSSVVFVVVWFEYVLDIKMSRIDDMLEQRANLSYGFMVAAWMAIAAFMVGYSGGDTFALFLHNLLLKAGIVLVVSMVVMLVAAWLLKIRTMDACAAYITDPSNNQKVILLVVALTSAVWLGMQL